MVEDKQVSRLRFSTSTLLGEEFVPWLASIGELAYTPYLPPERDYYFQYSWIIPGIFSAGTNLRRHYWFGGLFKDSPEVKLLFAFWNRRGRAKSTNCLFRTEAPVQNAKVFTLHRVTSTDTLLRLMNVHARSLADSVTSFNVVHFNVSRSETGYFNDRSFLLEQLCLAERLDPNPPIASMLYSGYALEEWCGATKFGSNYVKFRTPLTNIRITTFVCNETEVKVIDPNKQEVIESVGCRVREVCI